MQTIKEKDHRFRGIRVKGSEMDQEQQSFYLNGNRTAEIEERVSLQIKRLFQAVEGSLDEELIEGESRTHASRLSRKTGKGTYTTGKGAGQRRDSGK